MYKLLVLDIDGTIVRDNVVSSLVESAIKNVSVDVSLCTGRSIKDTLNLSDRLSLSGLHVAENGSKIINSQGDHLYDQALDPELSLKVLDIIQDIGFGKTYICSGGEDRLGEIKDHYSISRISVLGLNRAEANQLLAGLDIMKGIRAHSYPSSDQLGVDVQNQDTDKGTALRELRCILGLKKEKVLGVGDGYNDISMFSEIGYKVAMGNAVRELKEIADYVCPPLESDGVAYVINKFMGGVNGSR
jgi:HAD superfamily hydrolase (TIGR01484 family)